MAKNYILEPIEVEVSEAKDGFMCTYYVEGTDLKLEYDGDVKDLRLQIGDTTLLGAGIFDDIQPPSYLFTEDGVKPEGEPTVDYAEVAPTNAVFEYNNDFITITGVISSLTPPVTLTVSIYTGEDDEPSDEITPITRKEIYLDAIAKRSSVDINPITREEMFLQKILDSLTS